ncbi:MAG: ATP-binding cassette domain-containing protein [Candidatus Marinimicrobia bacterium]|nr:ATP-binding cassette domain-containing protein [Candidatus Neomarinimicrobiota bacterium]
MIQFDRVHLRYDSGISLRDLNFRVDPNEFIYLFGPSGSGKSSILRLIYMELFPNAGEVNVFNINSIRARRQDIAKVRQNIGMVFQVSRLLPDRDVYANIALPLELLGFPSKEVRQKVTHIADELNIRSRLNHYPHELSGGEERRLSLARASINLPDILLVDEPTAHLDEISKKSVMEAICRIHDRGTSVIFATHDDSLLRQHNARVLTLDSGTIIEDRIV